MPSVSERGGRWYVRYRDASGKWVRQVSTAETKTAARRLAAELERRAERQRLGLEPLAPADGGGTLAELLQWWLDTYSKGRPSYIGNVSSVKKHLIGAPIGALRLSDETSGRLEEFLQAKGASYAPQTVNHLRTFVVSAFNRAKKAGRGPAPTPPRTSSAAACEGTPTTTSVPRRYSPCSRRLTLDGSRSSPWPSTPGSGEASYSGCGRPTWTWVMVS
jgi:integrase